MSRELQGRAEAAADEPATGLMNGRIARVGRTYVRARSRAYPNACITSQYVACSELVFVRGDGTKK